MGLNGDWSERVGGGSGNNRNGQQKIRRDTGEIVRVLHADIGRGMEENELTIEQTK